MTCSDPPFLSAANLTGMANAADLKSTCADCSVLQRPGWESIPVSANRGVLKCVGTLRAAGIEEPALNEFHPNGTHGWSADAPIAVDYHPYNRCDVWQCIACRRVYLRYTEFGGYYEDERVRLVQPALVVEVGVDSSQAGIPSANRKG